MFICTKDFLEKNFKVKVESQSLLNRFNANRQAYQNNFDRLEAVFELLKHTCESGVKKQLNRKLTQYIDKEIELNKKDIRLRRALGIYIADPCPGVVCTHTYCGSRRCKQLLKMQAEQTERDRKKQKAKRMKERSKKNGRNKRKKRI